MMSNRLHRLAGILLASVALVTAAGCGGAAQTADVSNGSPALTDHGAGPPIHRLWQIAQKAAYGDGGHIEIALAVYSTEAKAEKLVSGAAVPGDRKAWLIQVEGVRPFVCGGCSRPAGAEAPTGRFMTLDIDAQTFEIKDFGLNPNASDLGSLGTVYHLHG